MCTASETSGGIDYESLDHAWGYAIGITYDGTVVPTGNGTYYERIRKDDRITDGYTIVKRNEGAYHDVSDWKLW